jgi:excisionase family DNA binding protein
MANTSDERLLLTVDEAAFRLHLSRPVVYALMNSGQLRSFKIGYARRIPANALDEYIAARLAEDDSTTADVLGA